MKTMPVLLVLLAVSMVAFAFVSTVAATDFSLAMVNSTQNGKIRYIWYFETYDQAQGLGFSGLDIIPGSIVAKCWDSNGVIYTVTPYDIVFAETSVELSFKNQDLPKSAIGNSVAGSLTTGDTFFASGPGWVWSNVH